MIRLLHLPIGLTFSLLQAMPLRSVAALGRGFGRLAWWLDRRRRRLALSNLAFALGDEYDEPRRLKLARDSFRYTWESILCGFRTASMSREEIGDRCCVAGLGKLRPAVENWEVPGIVIGIGRFANPVIYAHAALDLPWLRAAFLYRRSRSRLVDLALGRIRRYAPCDFFEQQADADQLARALRSSNLVLGLRIDQGAGPHGLAVPFFGRPASTSAAVALYALRRRMPLHVAICFRTGPGRWRVEVSDEIPTRIGNQRRPLLDILTELNSHLEHNIRRDPANWWWMTARWEHAGRVRKKNTSPTTDHD